MAYQSTFALSGLSLPASGSAAFSECGTYRYQLWRRWDESKPYVCFIGLNPSTADALTNDPTIRKCMKFARTWGYGALCMVNLFAFRATDPRDMKRAPDPVGPANDLHLANCCKGAARVVAAWGVDGKHQGRAIGVRALLSGCDLHHLGLTDAKEPKHPLYRPDSTQPEPLNNQALPQQGE